MSETRECPGKELLVTYLYGEADALEGDQVESHLAACAACAGEVEALRGLRVKLASWTPPRHSPGFHLVGDPVVVPIRRPWFRVPAWAQAAAAAVILLAAAAGIANLDIRYGPEGLAVRTGWQEADRNSPPAAQAPLPARPPVQTAASGAAAPWRADLVALAGELRQEIATRTAMRPVAAASPSRTPTEAELLERVADMIAANDASRDARWQGQLRRVSMGLERQRLLDAARTEQGLYQLENRIGVVQTESQNIGYVIRQASQKK